MIIGVSLHPETYVSIDPQKLEESVKEKHFHTEVCVLRMNASTHSQKLEENYE
jgi:hypothetical protein